MANDNDVITYRFVVSLENDGKAIDSIMSYLGSTGSPQKEAEKRVVPPVSKPQSRSCEIPKALRPKHGMAEEKKKMNDWIKIKEASQILNVCQDTLRVWERQGKLRTFKTLGGHRRFNRNEINAITQQMKGPVIEIPKDVPAETIEAFKKKYAEISHHNKPMVLEADVKLVPIPNPVHEHFFSAFDDLIRCKNEDDFEAFRKKHLGTGGTFWNSVLRAANVDAIRAILLWDAMTLLWERMLVDDTRVTNERRLRILEEYV